MQTLKNYEFNGFGFPVVLESVPAIEIDGELVPAVNWTRVGFAVVMELCRQPNFSLTGNHIKFIRTQFDMTMRDFAKWIGVVHGSVSEWEKKAEHKAQIESHTEFAIRMQAMVRAAQHLDQTTSSKIQLEEIVSSIDWQSIKKASPRKTTQIVQLDAYSEDFSISG